MRKSRSQGQVASMALWICEFQRPLPLSRQPLLFSKTLGSFRSFARRGAGLFGADNTSLNFIQPAKFRRKCRRSGRDSSTVKRSVPLIDRPRVAFTCHFETPAYNVALIHFCAPNLIVNDFHLKIRKATTNGTTSHASRIATGITRWLRLVPCSIFARNASFAAVSGSARTNG